jgi:Homeodomain-like domain
MEDSARVQVRSSKPEQTQLDKLLRGALQPVRTVLRALVLRQLADGQTIRKVARNVSLTPKTVWLTSQRYQQRGLDRALYEGARPGKEALLDSQHRQRIVVSRLFTTTRNMSASIRESPTSIFFRKRL